MFSSEWLSKPAHSDGHHHIVYNYSVGGAYYSGEFFQYGFETDDFLRPGDTFEIRYAADSPAKSYYPELRSNRKTTLLCIAIGAVLALIVYTIAFCTSRTH